MPRILTSWKEIGQYLGKGVRTVQRWERDADLPVRRKVPGSHSVMAMPEELDAWLHSQTHTPAGTLVEELRAEVTVLRAENVELRARLEAIEDSVMEKGVSSFASALPEPSSELSGHALRFAAQQCRAGAVRTRLSLAVTLCDLSESRARRDSLDHARRSALAIGRSLERPGYVPLSELEDLRATLNRLALRIELVAQALGCDREGALIEIPENPEFVN
jgi:hypothetical protein